MFFSKLFRKIGYLKRNPELGIRLLVSTTLCAIIIIVSTPNFKKLFNNQEPLISISLLNNKYINGIPVPDAYICVFDRKDSQKFETAIEKVTIEYQIADNNIASDYIFMNGTASNSTRVKFEPREEYPVPCLLFQQSNDSKLIYKREGIESIRIRFWRNLIRQTPLKDSIGLFYTTYVGIDNYQDGKTFKLSDGELHKLTFKSIERIDVEGNSHWYKESEKFQHEKSLDISGFLICEIIYFPIDFLVTRYTEKRAYNWVDFIASVGGLLTFISAIWLILFGNGKFKSWGIIQQYLLQSSPDAKKNRQKSKSKRADILHDLSPTSAQQNVDVPCFKIDRSPSHSPLSELNNNLMLGVDTMSHSNERLESTPSPAVQMNEIEVLKRKVKLLSQFLSQKYLQGFNSETYGALNELTENGGCNREVKNKN
ncbi:hypothetical protein G9A89_008333 [Geosiphon pyriformis]|nr:hypothetical protein G9A89_008333 [Geosiphon pyriformis]